MCYLNVQYVYNKNKRNNQNRLYKISCPSDRYLFLTFIYYHQQNNCSLDNFMDLSGGIFEISFTNEIMDKCQAY